MERLTGGFFATKRPEKEVMNDQYEVLARMSSSVEGREGVHGTRSTPDRSLLARTTEKQLKVNKSDHAAFHDLPCPLHVFDPLVFLSLYATIERVSQTSHVDIPSNAAVVAWRETCQLSRHIRKGRR